MKQLFYICFTLLLAINLWAQSDKIPVPSQAQLSWHEKERIMFVHFGMATWQAREYDNHTTDLSIVNPRKLNTDQWCKVAKSWGAKMIIFVAKHTGGFCWWQTETSDYGVKEIPWKDGKGDVMKDLSESCKKYGLELGVYIYPGDDHWGAGIGSGGICEDPNKQEAYNKIFRQQLIEVLSRYGKISEVWFDGNCKIPVSDILEKYAKDAVVFQGSDASLRWVGNEDGVAPYPNWYTLDTRDLKTGVATALASTPEGDAYAPVEIDVPLLKNKGHKWFWAPNTDSLILTTSQLMKLYYNSVGRGSILLLNSTPDTNGLIPKSHAKAYKEFGKELDKRFSKAKKGILVSKHNTHTLVLKKKEKINHLILQEDLNKGQLIQSFEVYYNDNGIKKLLTKGLSIGSKRIIHFDDISTDQIFIEITKTRNQQIAKLDVKAFYVETDLDDLRNKDNKIKEESINYWDQESFNSKDFTNINIDLTKHVNSIGEYIISFSPVAYDYSSGKSWALEFKDVQLEIYGTYHPELIEQINPWEFKITRSQQTLDEFKTIFHAKIKNKGASSTGEIKIKRISY